MSPQRMDNNFEGVTKFPPGMRGPGRRSDAYPSPTDIATWKECRGILDTQWGESWLTPVWDPMGWIEDEVLMCWRWADHLLSDDEREQVRRAREACALEEIGHG